MFILAVFLTGRINSTIAQPDSSGKYYNSFDGTKIYYEVKGSGDAVVLVHGFIVNGESWKQTALYKDLVQSGFQVITMDMRGNIMGLLNSLGIKSYSPVGYSRGSIITSRLLVLDKRVKSAVMGGMGSDFTDTA